MTETLDKAPVAEDPSDFSFDMGQADDGNTLAQEVVGEDDFDFSDLVAGGAEAVTRMETELKTQTFGTIDVNDFSGFQNADYVPQEGEYPFMIEQKWLREGTSTMKLVSQVSSRGSSAGIKLTINEKNMRLAIFNQACFGEILVPLFQPTNFDREISFVFDLGVLAKIASTFGDAVIEFIFNAKAGLLSIKSGNTNLELATLPPEDFVNYHDKLGSPVKLATLNPMSIKNGISYLAPYVRHDEVNQTLSLVDIRGGSMYGGNSNAIGMYTHNDLKDVNFTMKYEALTVIEKIMGRLSQTNTHLFEAGPFFLIRDENIYIGVEKSQLNFPDVSSLTDNPVSQAILIQRAELQAALNKLSVVSVDRKMMVRLEFMGLGKESKLVLTTTDHAGRESQDTIDTHRKQEGSELDVNLPNKMVYASLKDLLRVVTHFDTANVLVKFQESDTANVMYVQDTDDDTYRALTTLITVDPEKMSEIRAQEKQTTLEKVQGGKVSKKDKKTAADEEEAV